ncbi:MAG: chromosome partitioning protein ParB [Actinomycetota bacterium]|nr:chromosome partitioning protein ParB [Actinomycetota bacterium]
MARRMDTGFPSSDAQSDFGRARRRHVGAGLARRLRGEPSDVNMILPFDEVIAALGRKSERSVGLRTIDLDAIVGTVDRTREFDRSFRPTSGKVKGRWQRIAEASRRGEAMPPIDVYKIGDMYFVKDGHHRVSVARQLGLEVIEAHVTEIVTEVGAGAEVRIHDLALKSHERLFFERVPLPPNVRDRLQLSQGSWYAGLAEGVEAWGFRAMQACGEFMTREEVAREWFEHEFDPVVRLVREEKLAEGLTDAEAYSRIVSLRYLLLRTHRWDEETIERLRAELRHKPSGEDTLTHVMRGDLKG